MLRSQGIPARMVVGYHGGEFNYIGNYYVVRQSDAHAWVEAYLEPDEIPENILGPEDRHAGGGWLRLDPTPASNDFAEVGHGILDRASKSFDYARWLWNDYVLGLTSDRQRRAFLTPLALDGEVPVSNLADVNSWKKFFKELTGTDLKGLMRGQFSWRGGLAAIVACVMAYGIYRLIRSLLPLVMMILRMRPTRRRQRPGPTVAFYQRLEVLLRRIGLQRRASQTQREYAHTAKQRMIKSQSQAAAADLPDQIVDAFYRVRFGDQTPTPQQAAEIQQHLDQLEKAVQNK